MNQPGKLVYLGMDVIIHWVADLNIALRGIGLSFRYI